MSCLGVHFAIDAAAESRLLAAESDEDLEQIIEDIEDLWDREFLFETDKAWDAIHRCLTDGTLDCEGGEYPLSHVILGGEPLYEGEDYVIAYVPADEVTVVAAALAPIDRAWLRERYDSLEFSDYQGSRSNEDFDYTWGNFRGLAAFFQAAAQAGRAVIFTVDQ